MNIQASFLSTEMVDYNSINTCRRNAGLLGGVIGLTAIAAICVYCMTLLVRAAHKALRTRRSVRFLDYADTAHASFQDASPGWARFAPHIRKLLNIFLCASQITSNAVYALFIAKNIKPVRDRCLCIFLQQHAHCSFIFQPDHCQLCRSNHGRP